MSSSSTKSVPLLSITTLFFLTGVSSSFGSSVLADSSGFSSSTGFGAGASDDKLISSNLFSRSTSTRPSSSSSSAFSLPLPSFSSSFLLFSSSFLGDSAGCVCSLTATSSILFSVVLENETVRSRSAFFIKFI